MARIGMSLLSFISDGFGSGRRAKVTDDHALLVSVVPRPELLPIGTTNPVRFYSAQLGSTGADAGVVNMNVNGSVTSQDFFIAANNDFDLYITHIVILIADSAVPHNRFGNIMTVTNGWDLILNEAGINTNIVVKAKTNGEIILGTGLTNAFGDGSTSFIISNWTGVADALFVTMPIYQVVPGGLRIGRGSTDKLISRINDNFTTLDEFKVRVFGYGSFPAE
jgi:hypothetical protein